MNVVKLEQGTESWRAWRATRRMASESAALLGLSPWNPKTPLQLYEVKTNSKVVPQTPAMLHGIVNEGRAREHYEWDHDCVMPACVVEDAEGEYGASLDGRREDGRRILEIKSPVAGSRSDLWAEAFIKRVPTHYEAQVQHQIMVSGAEVCDFLVYAADIDSCRLVSIEPDPATQLAIRFAWDQFWPCYESRTPPEPVEGDFVERFDARWLALEAEYLLAKAVLRGAEAGEEKLRAELLRLAGDQSCRGEALRVTRYWARGNVDYAKIPELKGVDTEPFRKKGSYRNRITVEGNNHTDQGGQS